MTLLKLERSSAQPARTRKETQTPNALAAGGNKRFESNNGCAGTRRFIPNMLSEHRIGR
jgi:hypothetical protein